MDTSRYQGPLARALRRWWNSGFVDPWPKEIDEAVRRPDAEPVCLNCLMPQERHFWFCRECGHPGGEYLTVMPYLHIFTIGELMQRGVVGPPERRFWVTCGFVVVSTMEYTIFAPLYWFWMLRRALGRPICVRGEARLSIEESAENPPGPPPPS
jgi:hypothetical protein